MPPDKRKGPGTNTEAPPEAIRRNADQTITISRNADTNGMRQAAENADSWWWSCGWTAVQALAESGRPFTIEHVRELGVPEPDCPQRYGALIAAAVNSRLIAAAGAVVGSNGKAVRRWVGETR